MIVYRKNASELQNVKGFTLSYMVVFLYVILAIKEPINAIVIKYISLPRSNKIKNVSNKNVPHISSDEYSFLCKYLYL